MFVFSLHLVPPPSGNSVHVATRPVFAESVFRAIGTGPASPAAARPIFGQLTCAKIPYDFGGLFNCCSKSSYSRRNLG